jgi:hypothetical protein
VIAVERDPPGSIQIIAYRSFATDVDAGQRKSVLSRHMPCIMTAASLRASATMARRRPRRFATAMAQAYSQDHFETRVSKCS